MKCPKCNADLEVTLTLVGSEPVPVTYPCSKCGQSFATQALLDAHVASVHPPAPVGDVFVWNAWIDNVYVPAGSQKTYTMIFPPGKSALHLEVIGRTNESHATVTFKFPDNVTSYGFELLNTEIGGPLRLYAKKSPSSPWVPASMIIPFDYFPAGNYILTITGIATTLVRMYGLAN